MICILSGLTIFRSRFLKVFACIAGMSTCFDNAVGSYLRRRNEQKISHIHGMPSTILL
jgi:hypothetical protein